MDAFLRQYATPLSFITFLAVAITGLLMLFGVRSHAFSEVHQWIGLVFVGALALHLARNWRGVGAMLSAPKSRVFLAVAGVLTALLLITSFPLGGGGGYGHGGHSPRMIVYRLSAAPIDKLAPALGLTSDEAVARLRRGGIAVQNPQQSLNEIAAGEDERLPRLLNLLMAEG